jgi:hypothetical protein
MVAAKYFHAHRGWIMIGRETIGDPSSLAELKEMSRLAAESDPAKQSNIENKRANWLPLNRTLSTVGFVGQLPTMGRSRYNCAMTRSTYFPLWGTPLLVLWTILVSPYSKYGDDWAISPAVATLPLVIGLHVAIAYRARWSWNFIAYGLIHSALFFVIWIYCLMAISKDSL